MQAIKNHAVFQYMYTNNMTNGTFANAKRANNTQNDWLKSL